MKKEDIEKKEKKITKSGKIFSIRFKIVNMLLIMGIIPLALSGFTSYMSSKSILSEKLEITSSQTIREASRGIDNYFIGLDHLLDLLTMNSNIGSVGNKAYFSSAQKEIENVYDTDENIVAVFVGTEDAEFFVNPAAEGLSPDFDPRSREWYTLAMASPGSTIYTKPYASEADGGVVITMAKTISKNNKVIGVLGMDIDLTAFTSDLSQIKIGNTGYLTITAQDGFIITNPDSTKLSTDISASIPEWSNVVGSSDGIVDYNPQDGNSGFVVFYTSEITGWKIMAVIHDSELQEDTQPILNMTIIMLILMVICIVIASLWFSAPIARNIKVLVEAFKRVAKGDLTTRVNIKSKDEFATLGIDFNEMIENISGLMMKVNESSVTVLDTSAVLSSISQETSSAINEVARAIDEVAHGASEQAENSAEGANSISELSESLNLVEDATSLMGNMTEDASRLTIDGLNKMRTLSEKSNLTKDSTKRIAELIDDMNESTNKIDEISDTISKITAQTNLLALNASIEAARAGEAGKGFAVVADEIRNLAEQSKESTVEIKAIIEAIKEKSTLSVEAMGETENSVEEQEVVVGEARSVFNEITKAVSILSKKVKEVEGYTKDIAIKKENVIEQIENISAISEESASASEEVTASTEQITASVDEISKYAEDLQRLSIDLKERVNSFTFE